MKKPKEDRILQISNDIAEDMNFSNHTKQELRAVVLYWMNQTSYISNDFANFRASSLLERIKQMSKQLKK